MHHMERPVYRDGLLAAIVDLYSRKVVGWSLAERATAALVC
jgi:transposase InsO family protein